MNYDVAVSDAREIADRVLAPASSQIVQTSRFAEAVEALRTGGLLGLLRPIMSAAALSVQKRSQAPDRQQ